MKNLYELRVYPKREDAYKDNDAFIKVADKVTFRQAEREASAFRLNGVRNKMAIRDGEVVLVSHTDGKRYIPIAAFSSMPIDEYWYFGKTDPTVSTGKVEINEYIKFYKNQSIIRRYEEDTELTLEAGRPPYPCYNKALGGSA